MAHISDRSAASSSVHSTYKNQHPSPYFLLFAETTLSERIRHLSELIRSNHSESILVRSLFSSVSDFIRSLYFTFSFYGKNLNFLCPSPPFFLNPLVLGFVITCRQCLVRQVTSRLSVTGRVTRNCTRRVVEIQMN